jgi:hypothetical protein
VLRHNTVGRTDILPGAGYSIDFLTHCSTLFSVLTPGNAGGVTCRLDDIGAFEMISCTIL